MNPLKRLTKLKKLVTLSATLVAILFLFTGYSHGEANYENTYNQGVEYASEGKFKEAKTELSSIPESSTRYYGQAKGALKLIEKALIDPTREAKTTHIFKGHDYALKKQEPKAIISYTKALDLSPEFVEAYTARGSMYYFGLKDKEKGCADWKRACAYGECLAYNIAKDQGSCE